MHDLRLLTILTAAALCAVPPALRAAELGEPVVKSHTGQQLVADIELLADEGGPVRASIAPDDVYRGANIARSPVVDTLTLSVMRRDGRQFLHITSLKPVDAGYLHLYLELLENGKRKIRPATLWLQPEPAPAVVPVRAAVSVPAPVPAPLPLPVPVAPAAPAAAPAHVHAAAPARPPRPVSARPKAVAPDLACQALDYKNAQLSAQIVDLEEKVKALQYAVDMQGTKMPAPGPVKARPAAVSARPPVGKGRGAPVWAAFAGAGVLALGGGGWWYRRSRRVRFGEE